MAGFAEYERYDGLGLAGLVQARHVTPEELLEAAIARVEARNPLVNAVTMPLYDHARRAIGAGLPDGPFRGVPFLDEADGLVESLQDVVEDSLEEAAEAGTRELHLIQEDLHDAIAKLVYERLRSRPMILPVVVEV